MFEQSRHASSPWQEGFYSSDAEEYVPNEYWTPEIGRSWRERRDPRNDGAVNTWCGGDYALWRLCGELHDYDLAERNIHPLRRGRRALAKAIIEGRARWPSELLAWKRMTELMFYGGRPARFDEEWSRRRLPPWLDARNLPAPQLARVKARIAQVKADIARARRMQ